MPAHHRAMSLSRFLRPSFIEFFRQSHDIRHHGNHVDCGFLQLVERGHCFLFGEIGAKLFHNKVIVDPDCTVLAEKLRQLGAIDGKRLVGGENLERLAKDELLDESGLNGRVGLLHHMGKFVPFEVVKADFDMVAALVGNRRSSAFTELICHKKLMWISLP